jgi:FixJ family two-component response regulator
MEAGICELDMIAQRRSLAADEHLKQDEYSRNLERDLYLEEVSWRQKSRALQLKEGDNNKKFFHRLANLNKRNNSIESLMVDGNMTKESAIIQDHTVNFYFKKNVL